MIVRPSIAPFTMVQVALSLISIVAGLRRGSRHSGPDETAGRMDRVTGFLLPADRVLPWHIGGAPSLVVAAIASVRLHQPRRAMALDLRGAAVAALWLNALIAVVQAAIALRFKS